MVAEELNNGIIHLTKAQQELAEQESVLSLIKAVLHIKGISTLNFNMRALVHLLKMVLKPGTWQNLLQVNKISEVYYRQCFGCNMC